MKKITLLLCFIIVSQFSFAQQDVNTSFSSQMTTMFSPLNKNYVPHGILLDYGMEFTNVPAFNGTLTDSTFTNISTLKQIYNTLLSSRIRNVSTGFVTPQDFDTRLKNNREQNIITLSGLYFKYAQFVDNATIDGKLTYSNGKFYDRYTFSLGPLEKKPPLGGQGEWINPYQEMQTFVMTPAIRMYKGLDLVVKIPSEIFYSNYQNQIQSIQIDFGNGQGYVTIPFNQNIAISYTNEGVKTWKYKLNLTNGTSLYNQSRIKIKNSFKTVPYGSGNSQRNTNGITTYDFQRITATIPHLGQYASANLTIDLIDGNTQITKPLIVAEGFDLGAVINPENVNGNFDYNSFKDYLFYGGIELKNLIYNSNKQYDIIYVDWDNGVDYMQRNAYALEEVIKWVNQQKANAGSTEPNVVLGQSMGGVIARYALADMEERGENHDTRLFISHDAPQQGANIPVSVQFMYRHMTRQYIQSSIALFGGELLLPIFNNGVAGSDYLSLLDAPASRQLIKNFSTLSYSINNTVHGNFYADLKSNGLSGSGGYPINTRNIAISNGSECGNTQNFNAGEHLVNYQWNKGLSFWGDLLSLVYNPLGGYIGGTLIDEDFYGVAILGLIPGHSKYNVNFQAKSIPYGTGNMIYKGRVSYTKKILWLFNVTVNITNVQKNQPNGVLPFDSYGGGFFHLNFNPSSLSSNLYVRDRFGFIPTASALDIGENNVNLNDSDYLRAYVGGNPPTGTRNSPFDNFSTEFDRNNPNSHNHQHISFNTRNGDWLAKELNATNIEFTDCSAFCSDSEINGEDLLCSTNIYSVTNTSTSTSWWISEGNSLVTFTTNGSGNEITITRANSNSGYVTINVTISNPKCGNATISKRIQVGTPISADEIDNYLAIDGAQEILVETVGENGENLQWRVNGVVVNNNTGNDWMRIYFSDYPCINNQIVLSLRIDGVCGWSNWVSLNYSECEDDFFRFSSNPMKSGNTNNKIIIVEKNSKQNININRNYIISIFNNYGREVYSKTHKNKEFTISQLKRGFYFVKFQTERGKIITKILIVE